jgi:hypothetical protein
MPNSGTPEPPHRRELASLLAQQKQTAADVSTIHATLTLRDLDGNVSAVAPLGNGVWQPLAGREGVDIYHVPNPSGEPGLFMTVACTRPGAHYEGSVLDESRLLAIIEGDLRHNGLDCRPGRVIWVAPGEPSTWSSEHGCLAVVRYDVPPPDLDLSDIITPIKP